ncbi:hypothetical protein RZS08_39485, partial [Arthrospira platensis SPKY1]|nr:hypothetical protein [Arthrospira platensis SPKY1]
MKEVTKVCIDPHCEEVAHNCPKSETRCRTCGMVLVEINEKTYEAKFRDAMWQIDYRTGRYYRPILKEGTQL